MQPETVQGIHIRCHEVREHARQVVAESRAGRALARALVEQNRRRAARPFLMTSDGGADEKRDEHAGINNMGAIRGTGAEGCADAEGGSGQTGTGVAIASAITAQWLQPERLDP